MSRVVVLDAGPLGLLVNPRRTPPVLDGIAWMQRLVAGGVALRVPEIADYEVRRELLRIKSVRAIRLLDGLATRLGYLPLTTEMMRQAAAYWAEARQHGMPTAPDLSLDGDVILAAQATVLRALGDDVVIATTNPRHLNRFVPAVVWQTITA